MKLHVIIDRFLFKKDAKNELERKVFILAVLALFFISILKNSLNIILGRDVKSIIVTSLASVILLALILIARRTLAYKKYIFSLFLLSIVFVFFFWKYNGGHVGDTITLIYLIFLGLYFTVSTKRRSIVFFSLVLLLSGLMLYEYYNPEIIIGFDSGEKELFYLLFGHIIFFVFFYFIVDTIFNNYIEENRKVAKINRELQGKKEEIEKSNQYLRLSEEKFRIITEQVPDVIFQTDSEGNILYLSNATKRIFGLEPQEMTGKPFMSFLHEPYIVGAVERFKKTMEEKLDTVEFPLVVKKSDGNLVNVELNASASYDNGALSGTVGIIRDVSERIKAQKEILLLSKVVAQSPASILITDVKGRIEYVNDNFCLMTGYNTEEILGHNPRILKSDKQDASFYEDLWKTLLEGNNWQGEICNRKKNGDLFWEQAVIFPIKNNSDKISQFIAIKQDITERKRMEKDLLLAKEKAEESDRLKSSFLANMSHEIRTPLNGILGFAKLLERDNLDNEKKSKYFKIMKKNAESLLHIINDILDISRIESGQLELVYEIVDINKLIYDLFEQYIVKTSADIQLEHIPYTQKLEVNTDEFRLRQIFINLIDNAFKFTEHGKISFGVSTVENGFVNFFVSDTGIGISQKDIDTIFYRFRQVESKKLNVGIGLGLAIVKQLVDMMKGDISIKSTLEKGTVFNFRIPLK